MVNDTLSNLTYLKIPDKTATSMSSEPIYVFEKGESF
jgi:hypothetical protein